MRNIETWSNEDHFLGNKGDFVSRSGGQRNIATISVVRKNSTTNKLLTIVDPGDGIDKVRLRCCVVQCARQSACPRVVASKDLIKIYIAVQQSQVKHICQIVDTRPFA